MLDGFARGKIMVLIIIGILLVTIGLFIFISYKNRAIKLEGELIYDIGRSLLKRSIVFDQEEEMVFSIGPKVLSDNHIKLSDGSSFKFTVKAVRSGGEKIIHIKCDPPGLLMHNGVVKSEVDLFNGEYITMNGIPIEYNNGEPLNSGENILKGRIKYGTIDE